ncbi:MAG: hypothetical protein IKU29_00200 [Parabacteroides sp.]|nr:hypothetical protein [Parabacteroides sp.]
MNFEILEIECCEYLGEFEDEYVYDIEMNDPSHTFIANNILVHNSIYTSYEPLLKSIQGYEQMTTEIKRDIIVTINKEYLDKHNREFMEEYYETRHCRDMVHEFELETVALSGVWLNVKKRYSQLLLWKDGKTYELDNLPMKTKGLEIAKASYPTVARKCLQHMIRFLLNDAGENFLLQRLNIEMMKQKEIFMNTQLEDICGNMKVNGYTKYILDDTDEDGLVVADKCPSNVRALGTYNWFRNVYNLPGDPIYGGKLKWYCWTNGVVRKKGKKNPKFENVKYFAFQSGSYPKWADQYAPVNRCVMYEKMLLDPFNRIIESAGIGKLYSDGALQSSLFDFI